MKSTDLNIRRTSRRDILFLSEEAAFVAGRTLSADGDTSIGKVLF
ncbi:hypothetical protein [Roseibium marinum]|nr:hypothetical protein [Roseibium marinum]